MQSGTTPRRGCSDLPTICNVAPQIVINGLHMKVADLLQRLEQSEPKHSAPQAIVNSRERATSAAVSVRSSLAGPSCPATCVPQPFSVYCVSTPCPIIARQISPLCDDALPFQCKCTFELRLVAAQQAWPPSCRCP